MIEVHERPRHVVFKNFFEFFVSDRPKLRNHKYQKKKWSSLGHRISAGSLKKKIVYTFERFL